MSERERLYRLLDSVPDSKIPYIIGYIQGLAAEDRMSGSGDIAMFGECEETKRSGGNPSLDGLRMDLFKR